MCVGCCGHFQRLFQFERSVRALSEMSDKYTKTNLIQCSSAGLPDISSAKISPSDIRIALRSYNPTLIEATSHGRLISLGTRGCIHRLHRQTPVIIGVLWNVLQGRWYVLPPPYILLIESAYNIEHPVRT